MQRERPNGAQDHAAQVQGLRQAVQHPAQYGNGSLETELSGLGDCHAPDEYEYQGRMYKMEIDMAQETTILPPLRICI